MNIAGTLFILIGILPDNFSAQILPDKKEKLQSCAMKDLDKIP